MAAMQNTAPATAFVCKHKARYQCKAPADEELVICCGCNDNHIHESCVIAMCDKATKSVPRDPTTGAINSVCGLRCYKKIMTKQPPDLPSDEGIRRRSLWTNDGPSREVSSMTVLIDWMTDEGNYVRWKGGDEFSGETKKTICSEIIAAMKEQGITTDRLVKDVHSKICALESQYRLASDWLNHTGQGVECEKSIKEAVLKRCLYFYELDPVMKDRPSTRALYTNLERDAFFSSSDDDARNQHDVTARTLGDSNQSGIDLSEDDNSSRASAIATNNNVAVGSNRIRQQSANSHTPPVVRNQKNKRTRKQSPSIRSSPKHHMSGHAFEIGLLDQRTEETKQNRVDAKNQAKQQKKDRKLKKQELKFNAEVALANASKLVTEERVLRAKAELATTKANAFILDERARLLEKGISINDIDMMIPLSRIGSATMPSVASQHAPNFSSSSSSSSSSS